MVHPAGIFCRVNPPQRYGVSMFQQSVVFGKAMYVAREIIAGKPTDNGGVFRLILDGPGSPKAMVPTPPNNRVEINENQIFIRNTYGGMWMSGLAVDSKNSRLFFSVGAIVYMTNITADPTLANYTGKANDVKVCDVTTYLYPLAGTMAGYIVGLAYNPTADEVYVHGVNTGKARRLVTCSVAGAKVTHYNKYDEGSSAYGDLKVRPTKRHGTCNILKYCST
jgi:hypothetical protein